jgi:hypothetical protein
LVYDEVQIGFQRFYVEGTGDTAGSLWYCGQLYNFSDGVEATGQGRLNLFKVQPMVSLQQRVTFCLDSSKQEVMGPSNPFKLGCDYCDCANWTLFYDDISGKLTSQLSMSGFSDGSRHLWVEMTRIGDAPVISNSDVAGHGANFSCDFSEPDGRDSDPVDRNPLINKASGTGCPMLTNLGARSSSTDEHKKLPRQKTFIAESSVTSTKQHNQQQLQYCYVLNNVVDFRLEWTINIDKQELNCAISVPWTKQSVSGGDNVWVAIGYVSDSSICLCSMCLWYLYAIIVV